MWRNGAVLLAVVGIVAVPALSKTNASHSSASAPIAVKPASGSPGTHFVVSFRAVVQTGAYGTSERRYEASVTGPSGRSGCVSNALAQFPISGVHVLVHASLTPSTFGGRWCTGVFRGQIELLQMPSCPPHELCPAYVAILTKVGKFSFRVS